MIPKVKAFWERLPRRAQGGLIFTGGGIMLTLCTLLHGVTNQNSGETVGAMGTLFLGLCLAAYYLTDNDSRWS